jgi:hypothetical protein
VEDAPGGLHSRHRESLADAGVTGRFWPVNRSFIEIAEEAMPLPSALLAPLGHVGLKAELPPRAVVVLTCAPMLLVASMVTGFPASAGAFAVFEFSDRGRSWIHSDAGIPRRSRINAFGSVGEVLERGPGQGACGQ